MDQVLGRMLRQAVWDRLDMLDKLASSADNGSLVSVARSELPRLTHGWRALLAAHAPDPRGRCPECSSRWRPRAALCSVWQAAHEHLIAAENAAAENAMSEAVLSGRHPASLLPIGASSAG
ncbi:MAG: hypothetical protein ACRDRU_19440 [Pseudonocardiaceae bacterium]